MIKEITILKNSQIKKTLIFLIVSVFAIQALSLIITLGHDIPLSDDGDQIFIAYLIENEDKITLDDFFGTHMGHIPFFIRIVSVPLLLAFSFTSMPILYFQWGLLTISLIITYYLLKQTNEKSTWLIIPISMLIFNPLQEYTLTWVLGGLQQTLPFLSYIVIIYILTKKTITVPKISLAIFFVSVAMFTNQAALFFWPVMLLSFIKKDNKKKWITIWLVAGLILSMLYFTQISVDECKFGNSCEDDIVSNALASLTKDGKIYAFFFSASSIAFRLKFNELYIMVGITIVFTFVLALFYALYNKEKLHSSIAWIQYGLIGLIYVSLLTLGRFHAWGGDGVYIDTYYITLTSLIPIGLMVLGYQIFSYWKNEKFKNKKTLLNFVLIISILAIVVMLIPSHVIGWKIAEEQYNWKENNFAGCLGLPANSKNYETFEYCSEYFIPTYMLTHNDRQEFAPEIWNFFLKNNYNVFASDEFREKEKNDLLEFSEKLKNINHILEINGIINEINSEKVKPGKIFEIDTFQITIEGTMNNFELKNKDNLFLFLNDKPFSKILSIDDSKSTKISWSAVFLSEYLPEGCHELSLGFIEDDSLYVTTEIVNVCRK